MSLFTKFFTRKNKPKKESNDPLPLSPPPPTPHQAALMKKLSQEIISLVDTRKARSTQFASTIMSKNAGNVFVPFENPAIEYLLNVLEILKTDPNPFFFNEAYAEFLRRKNAFVQANTNIFPKRKTSLPLINGVLRRMRQYAARLNNTNNSPVTPRPTRRSFGSVSNSQSVFSNTESNSSSLPSLQSLRNNTRNLAAAENAARRRTPRRRLRRKGVNQGTPPPTEA